MQQTKKERVTITSVLSLLHFRVVMQIMNQILINAIEAFSESRGGAEAKKAGHQHNNDNG